MNLTNQFLVATPKLQNDAFNKSVVYVCQHAPKNGAMGIVINHLVEPTLADVLTQLEISVDKNLKLPQHHIIAGGPIEAEHGFVIHSPIGNWKCSMTVNDHIAVTTSRDILEALAINQGPEKTLMALGYAGWEEGQLEEELAENCWLTCEADPKLIFETPIARRWEIALKCAGVKHPRLMSTVTGNA